MSTAINVLDRNSDARKILWALLASFLLHLLVAFSLATFGGKLTTSAEPDERPPELTIVNVVPTPPPTVPKNAPFFETNASKKTAEEPKEKTFESNENSIAASQLPATGESALPSQEGKDRPFPNLETQDASLGLETKPPQPTPAPSAMPTPQATQAPPATPTPAPAATPPPDQFAMLTATPPPAMKTPEEIEASPTPESAMPTPAERAPEQPDSAYRAYKEQTRIRGRVTNRGVSSVNAVGTPLGRYQKTILDSIGSRWLYYTKKQGDLIAIGTAHVSFWIDRQGHVQDLRMSSNSSNEAFANVCIQSVQEIKAPPIPDEVYDVLPAEGLNIDVSFTMFAN
jgi:outer membrane biosynthesis protein TonB